MTVSIWTCILVGLLAYFAGALTGLLLMCLVELHKENSKEEEEKESNG